MRLISLEVRNFRKLGKSGWVRINFPEEGIVAVVGENEAGKSTLADAIFYALTGRTRGMVRAGREEKERAEDVISWGAREAEVKLKFRVGEAEYEVYRRRSRSSGYARLAGRRNVEGWEAVNKAISELMSGMNDLSLITTVFSAQKDTDRPVKMEQEDRRKVIAGIIGMDEWQEAKGRLEKMRGEKKHESSKLERDIDNTKSRIEEIERAARDLDKKERDLEGLRKELENLPQEMEKVRKSVELLEEAKRRYEETKRELEDKGKNIAVRERELKRIEGEKEELESDIERLKDDLAKKEELRKSKEEIINRYKLMAGKLSDRKYQAGVISAFLLISALGLLLNMALVAPGLLLAAISYLLMRSLSSFLMRRAESIMEELRTMMPEHDQLKEKENRLKERNNEIKSLIDEIKKLRDEEGRIKAEIEGLERKVGGNPVDLLSDAKKKQGELEGRKKELEKQKKELEEEIEKIKRDRERLDDLKKQLEDMKRKKEELDGEIEVINLAIELIDGVISRMWGSIAPSVGNNMSKFLHKITLGRYYRAKVGEEDWSVSVYVPERASIGQDPYVSVFRMSGGTQDQVILALRLAVITSLVGRGANWPEFLILDEVLGATDDRRREGAIELLKSLKQQFPQIVLITHQDDVADMADEVLKVEDGMVHEVSVRAETAEN